MRILLATHARGPIGGVETYLRGLAPALAARGHAVGVLYEHRFESAPAGPDPYAGLAQWDVEQLGAEAAIAAARAWRPDRIWIHGLHDAGLEQGLLASAPALLYAHNYDGSCATGTRFRQWPSPQACARRMGAACVAINFTRHCGMLRPQMFAASFQRQRQRRAAFARYRTIVVASRHMAHEIERHRDAGAKNMPVRVLGYPCWTRRETAPPPRSGPPRTVLMLSRLTRAKGGHVLLDAVTRAEAALGRRLHVTIAGEGPEREPLREQAARLGIEAELPGWNSPAERERLLRAADVVAVPSLWPEPFGMTGIEAAAQGVPSVAFALGGIPDWLTPGTGELAAADPPTAAGLAAALAGVLGDTARWQALCRGAWEQSARFDLARHLEAVEAVLDA